MTTLFLAALLLIVALLAAAGYAYNTCFYSPKSRRPKVDDPLKGEQYVSWCEHIFHISHVMESERFEPVWIKAKDGTRLYGRYYHVADGAPVKLLFHGYRSHAYRDSSGGHALARKMGLNTLVVDQRAHGASGSNTITFGIRERQDVACWAAYVAQRFGSDTPIILSGLSMGAATVLMASDLPLPPGVACIIADAPYSSPEAIIRKVCGDQHYPPSVVMPFVRLGARIFGQFSVREASALESVRNTNIPILLIHGEDDRFVPCSMSHEIAENCAGPVTLYTFPGAGHGLCYMVDPKRYERIICQFLQSIPSLRSAIRQEFRN